MSVRKPEDEQPSWILRTRSFKRAVMSDARHNRLRPPEKKRIFAKHFCRIVWWND